MIGDLLDVLKFCLDTAYLAHFYAILARRPFCTKNYNELDLQAKVGMFSTESHGYSKI